MKLNEFYEPAKDTINQRHKTDTRKKMLSLEELGKLRKIGCGVSIDDFGTGYSSLAYLSRLPVDTLKIDRSFVAELSSYCSALHPDQPGSGTEQAQSIALAILSLAASLDMRVVAEGVEHLDQLQFLKEHGCHAVQGYLFGKPMPEWEFIEFITRMSQG